MAKHMLALVRDEFLAQRKRAQAVWPPAWVLAQLLLYSCPGQGHCSVPTGLHLSRSTALCICAVSGVNHLTRIMLRTFWYIRKSRKLYFKIIFSTVPNLNLQNSDKNVRYRSHTGLGSYPN